MKKLAGIYERKGALFVSADHKTLAGFWVADERVDRLEEPSNEDLGETVLAALSRSQAGVPTPPPTAKLNKPLLEAARVSSWGTFMSSSKHVSVSLNDGSMKISPYRNLGKKDGFEPQQDVTLAYPISSSALGQNIIETLAQID